MMRATSQWRRILFCGALALCAAIGEVRADSDSSDSMVAGGDFIEGTRGPWEFGLDFGEMIPTKRGTFRRDVGNINAYVLLANESAGDEVREGWVAPPPGGTSVVAGTMKPLYEFGLHVYRRLNSWFSWGLDGGYGLQRDLRIDSPGIYVPNNFMIVHYKGNMMHLSFPFKISARSGRWAPYLLVGPGLYKVSEWANISFNDSDDPQLQPLGIIWSNNFYGGVNSGAGLECRLGAGLIGVEAQYHAVFSPGNRFDFVLPKLRLAVLF